jgi:hypothetical protein
MNAISLLFAVGESSTKPAGGAAIDQIVIATVAAMIVTGALLYVGIGHRNGKVKLLARLGDYSERISGLPAWAAVPAGMIVASLIVALFGMLWDISLHIADGRDEGPLANPAHYFILFGLFGVFASGYISMVLPRDKPSSSAIRITRTWYAPLGGVLIAACGAFSLIGFPLDDMWHRLFGQDVTLWGPTHLMLFGGAAMTLIGLAVLLVEGKRASAGDSRLVEVPWAELMRRVSLPGGLLLGMSTLQGEFDFGVPQFRLIFHPMLIMLAAGLTLVAARIWLGRGSAIGAVVFFLIVRGIIAVIVGPVLGEPTPHFPLYVVEALIVEGVALALTVDRPLRFGAVCGALIGTVGLAAEWAWSRIWMPFPWNSGIFPEGAIFGFLMAIAASLVGAWIGAHLASDRLPRERSLRLAAVGSAIAMFVLVGYSLYTPSDKDVRAQVALTTVKPGPDREVQATVRLSPRDAADDAAWVAATAWQGGGLVVDPLKKVAPGVYRTTEPIPVSGGWKSLIRLQKGNSLTALPVYLPADSAIPVAGIPARNVMNRPFVSDHKLLQREQKTADTWLWALAYGVILIIAFAFLCLLAWGLHRLAVGAAAEQGRLRTEQEPRRPAPARRSPPARVAPGGAR